MKKSEHLIALHKAIALSEKIMDSLKDGDSDLANSIADGRLSLIQNIDFLKLTQQHPDIAPLAIEQFEKTNIRLIKTSSEIKDTVAEEIKKIKKSLSGTKAYNDISKQ
ncbi:MAG: hypothetical protein ACJA0N_001128 [Pseudohongiellaceae bacterium]|jgi:hypothetical protein